MSNASDISLDSGAGGSENDLILKKYREAGFAIAGLQPAQGIFRGSGTIIFLMLLKENSSSYDKNP